MFWSWSTVVASGPRTLQCSDARRGMEDCCRICGRPEAPVSMFESEATERELVDKIHAHLPLKVEEGDGLPSKVCRQCIDSVLAWHDLYQTCIRTNALFASEPVPQKSQDEPSADPGLPHYLSSFCTFRPVHDKKRLKIEAGKQERTHVEDAYADGRSNGEIKNDFNEKVKISKDTVDIFKVPDDETREENPTLKEDDISADADQYECSICNKKLISAYKFVIHMTVHSGEKSCMCHLCGKQFRIKSGLQRHVRETHMKIKTHVCQVCKSKFANRQNLTQHQRIHTGERPFVCTVCGKKFKQKGSLYIHNKTHSDHYPFECLTCDAKFRTRNQLTHHNYKHTGELPHVCSVCGHGFREKHTLNSHKRVHSGEKPFSCAECGISFGQRRYLRNHNKRIHVK